MPLPVPHFHQISSRRLFANKNVFFYGPKKTRSINIGNNINIGNRQEVRNRVGNNPQIGDRMADTRQNIYNRPENRARNADRATVSRDLKQARPATGRANDVYADRNGQVARADRDQWQTREGGQWKDAGAKVERPAQRPETRPAARPPGRRRLRRDTRSTRATWTVPTRRARGVTRGKWHGRCRAADSTGDADRGSCRWLMVTVQAGADTSVATFQCKARNTIVTPP